MVYKKSNKSEERKDEKRQLIFKSAAKVFAENGFHEASVKNIAEEAKISVGTFYLYFKNKEEIFEKLYDEMAKIIESVNYYALYKKGASVVEKFSRAITSSVWAYKKYNELAKILLIDAVGLNPTFERKYAQIM